MCWACISPADMIVDNTLHNYQFVMLCAFAAGLLEVDWILNSSDRGVCDSQPFIYFLTIMLQHFEFVYFYRFNYIVVPIM
jgi:hypothetical protein